MTGRPEATVEVLEGALVFRVARRLRSPNTWQGHHWRVKDNDTKIWQHLLLRAVPMVSTVYDVWRAMAKTETEWREAPARRRVTVVRVVPTGRHLIRDDDNLRFCTKPLNDALRRMGLIYQDSREWLDQPMPEQRLASDGHELTVITIAPGGEGGRGL